MSLTEHLETPNRVRAGSASSTNVLLVEDDNDIQISLIRALTLLRPGITIHAATTVKDGLDYIINYHTDVLITDIKLPDSTGHKFIQMLHERDIQTQVIMMTAFGTYQMLEHAAELDSYAYIEKPFAFDLLTYFLDLAFKGKSSYELPLRDLLEYYTLKHANIVLHITIDSYRALIYIEDGVVAHVQFQSLEGVEALAALLVAPEPQIFTAKPTKNFRESLQNRTSLNINSDDLKRLDSLHTQTQFLCALRSDRPLELIDFSTCESAAITTSTAEVFRVCKSPTKHLSNESKPDETPAKQTRSSLKRSTRIPGGLAGVPSYWNRVIPNN